MPGAPPLPTPLHVLGLKGPGWPATDDDRLRRAFAPLVAGGDATLTWLPVASENALRRALAAPCHVIVFAGFDGRAQAAAKLALLTLQADDGRSREVSAQHLGALLAGAAGPRLALLVDCPPAVGPLAADRMVQSGLPAALVLPPRSEDLLGRCLGALRQVLMRAQPLAAALADLPAVHLAAREPDQPLWSAAVPSAPAVAPAEAMPAADSSPKMAQRAEEPARSELDRKRRDRAFDVFLCHNGSDKPAVKRIAERLMARGVLPWLDEWELPPGQPWQPLLEQQIGRIGAAAVFVGSAGIGPWQRNEMYGFLSEFVERGAPVIPVLLPDAPAQPELPRFLRAMTWVDFRKDEPEPLERLLWGITGRRGDR